MAARDPSCTRQLGFADFPVFPNISAFLEENGVVVEKTDFLYDLWPFLAIFADFWAFLAIFTLLHFHFVLCGRFGA